MSGLAAVALLVIQSTAAGQPVSSPESPSPESLRKLAQAVENPLASVATLRFEFNWDSGVGPNHDLRTGLNIRPQVPVLLPKDLTLLSRLILPFLSQPVLVQGGEPSAGFSDIIFSLLLTPTHVNHVVWAIGPGFGLPMTSDPRLGSGTWDAGLTVGAVVLKGDWQLGVVASQLWPIADTGHISAEGLNHALIQSLITYTTRHLVTFTLQSETTIDWNTHGVERTAIPIELLISRLRLGILPVSVQLGGGPFLETPSGGPDWRLRLAFVVVVPQRE